MALIGVNEWSEIQPEPKCTSSPDYTAGITSDAKTFIESIEPILSFYQIKEQ